MSRTGRPPKPEEHRFFQLVAQSGDCWLWIGSRSHGGYGWFKDRHKKTCYAHRWSYQFFISDIPEGLQLDHLCRNRACVNPWHLEPVTARVNTLRGLSPVALRSRYRMEVPA